MRNKIILGSANFDQIYGIKKNFIKKSEIKKLFDLALKNEIKIIDTSPTYKESEKIIGLLNNKRFKIISKIPKPPKNIKRENIQKWLKQNVMISLKNLKIKKFECLLLHNANSLLSKNGDEIYKGIRNMKISGFTNKIGVSIYDFNVLDKILKKFKFNLIQAPFNILDQRLVKEGWLKKLKKRKKYQCKSKKIMKNSLGHRLKIQMKLESNEERKKRVAQEKKDNAKIIAYFERIHKQKETEKAIKVTTDQFKELFWKEGKKYFANEKRLFNVDENNKLFLDVICRYFANDLSFEKVTNGELRKGLLIYGNCGTGKSSMFDIVQRVSLKYNLRHLYFTNISVHDVVNQFNKESTQNKLEGGESIIDKYSRGPVHFDDLGTEKMVQAWGIKENLFDRLLQTRYNGFKAKGTKTFVTTNLSIQELQRNYSKQVKDRLYQMFNFIELNGESRRF